MRLALQRGIRRIHHRVDHRPEVLQRRVELHVMRRAEDQPAVLADGLQPRRALPRARRPACRTAACAARRSMPQKHSWSPYCCFRSAGSMQAGWIGFSTSRPISIRSGMIGADVAVRVVGDFQRRVDRLQLRDEVRHARLEELAATSPGEISMPFCVPTSSPIQIISTPISTSFLAAVR